MRLLVGGITYFLLAKFGMALFSLQPSNITLLWLPLGVGLLMCLSAGTRALPYIFLASFFSDFSGMALPSLGMQILHTLVSAVADTLAAWLAAFMLRRHLPSGLSQPVDLIPFTFFVCIVPTLISAVILAGNLALGGYIAWGSTVDFIFMLLVGDSLGILLCYPLLEAWNNRHRLTRADILPWLLLTGCVLLIVHLAFAGMPAMIFLLIPAFLYMIFRKEHVGEHVSFVLVVCLIVAEAAQNLGPFQVADAEQGRQMLIVFLFAASLTVAGMQLQQQQLLAKQALLAEQNTQLSRARDAAEAANTAKGNFLGNMSHEMRTPLHQIAGLAKLMRREPLTPKQVDRMNMLDSAVRRLTGIIEALLDLTRIESMQSSLSEEAFAVENILDDVAAKVQEQALARQLALKVEHAAPGLILVGDRAHIQRALLNYAANAVTFTESGSVTLRARVDTDDGATVLLRFEVQDSGIGIAAQDIPRLFSLFEQVDNSSTRKYGGLGVGLTMTRKIAQVLGGDAGCESMPGQGSTFWFTVRLRKER